MNVCRLQLTQSSVVTAGESVTKDRETKTCKKSGGLLPSDSEALNMPSCVQGIRIVHDTIVC